MNRGRWVAGVLLALVACAPLPTMQDYCAQSGTCQCADGACCALGHQACNADVPCCAGMECSGEGFCVLEGPVPTLKATPAELDFGWVDADVTPPQREVVISNEGAVATRPLGLELQAPFEGSFALDPGDCAGAELAAGATCRATVTFVAAGAETRVRSAILHVREAPAGLPSRDAVQLSVSGEAGHELTVSVLGDSPVFVRVEDLPAVNVWPPQQILVWRLRRWTAIFDAPGHHPTHFSPGSFTAFPIALDVPARVHAKVSAQPNVQVDVQAGPKASIGDLISVTIRWMQDGQQWQRWCTSNELCRVPAEGTVSFTYSPGSVYTGPFTWTGACAGNATEVCVLEGVNGPVAVGVTTE